MRHKYGSVSYLVAVASSPRLIQTMRSGSAMQPAWRNRAEVDRRGIWVMTVDQLIELREGRTGGSLGSD